MTGRMTFRGLSQSMWTLLTELCGWTWLAVASLGIPRSAVKALTKPGDSAMTRWGLPEQGPAGVQG